MTARPPSRHPGGWEPDGPGATFVAVDATAHRALRAGVLAVLSALLVASAHVAGGGAVPDLAVVPVLLPLVGGAVAGLGRRCSGPVGLLAVLAAGQGALHGLLELLHHHPPGPPVTDPATMLAAHVAATLVTAVLVRHADRALRLVARALRRLRPRRIRTAATVRPLPVRPVPAGPAAVRRLLLAAHSRRGPPVAC
jgi:hypothetical protein